MPSIFGCLSETYFRCCEQWFCFDKKIALYTSNDSFGPNSYGKSYDQTTIPVVWSGKDIVPVAAAPVPVMQTSRTPEVITEEPKANSEPKFSFEETQTETNEEENANKDTNTVDDESKKDEGDHKQRRRSASEIKLTIHDYEHDHRTDIPVIRQQNVPKFYIGTPEQTEFDWNRKPKSAFEQQQDQLAKEMNPHLTAFHFNLKTIRDMHLEPLPQQRSLAASKAHENSSFSKLFHFKTKFKAFSHQKRTGSKSVPNFPIYS